MQSGTFRLERFTAAQAPVLAAVMDELRAGRKRTHWMWFVFPQLRGLGSSPAAQFYGLESLDEARAYRADPALGPRLVECTQALLVHRARPLEQILGAIDALKFRSCMTLFEAAAEAGSGAVFSQALDRLCGGVRDARTLALLEPSRSA